MIWNEVVCLGDSLTFGARDRYGRSYPLELGKILSEKTGEFYICHNHGINGEMYFFNPSSTTFVKHFNATTSNNYETDANFAWYTAGYINTTAAVTAIQFKMSDAQTNGTIKLYGIKDS